MFFCDVLQIDPYINIDAGTFSPYEHGEVFVLDDGGYDVGVQRWFDIIIVLLWISVKLI